MRLILMTLGPRRDTKARKAFRSPARIRSWRRWAVASGAFAAVVTAGTAHAQYTLGALPALLKTQANQKLSDPSGTSIDHVVSFSASQFGFAAEPPLFFSLVPGFAYYAARCSAHDVAPGASRDQADVSKKSADNGLQNTPPSSPSPSNGVLRNILSVLPPRPQLPSDHTITMDISSPANTLSFAGVKRDPSRAAVGNADADALVTTWGLAAVQGHSQHSARGGLASGKAPYLGDGTIIITVTPTYHLKNVGYQASVSLDSYVVKERDGRLQVAHALPGQSIPVSGLLSGGRWVQGSGLLFIPAPQAFRGMCGVLQAVVQPLNQAMLAAHGITPGTPFKVNTPGAIFVRTSQ